MDQISSISIGIQARSTSERFPRKVFEEIGGVSMLQHVINAAKKSASYTNKYTWKTKITANVNLLIPQGDEIKTAVIEKKLDLGRTGLVVHMQEGPLDDVLTRYMNMATRNKADYIVRITADCPLIPPYVISKLITTTLANNYDYCSNVDERLRTYVDGMDCEVISMKALAWLDQNAKGTDREHVTTLLRREPPNWSKIGHVVGFLDLSDIKLSVDTVEDLEQVRKHYDKIKSAIELGERVSGKNSVHRF